MNSQPNTFYCSHQISLKLPNTTVLLNFHSIQLSAFLATNLFSLTYSSHLDISLLHWKIIQWSLLVLRKTTKRSPTRCPISGQDVADWQSALSSCPLHSVLFWTVTTSLLSFVNTKLFKNSHWFFQLILYIALHEYTHETLAVLS